MIRELRVGQLSDPHYAQQMNEAAAHGRSVQKVTADAKAETQEQLKQFHQEVVEEVKAAIQRIGVDPLTPETTRKQLVDLWTTYLEIKGYVDNPRGSPQSYAAKVRELNDRYHRLMEGLKLTIGVTDIDDE